MALLRCSGTTRLTLPFPAETNSTWPSETVRSQRVPPNLSDTDSVSTGAAFVILSKTKGWWVVHRDQASPPTNSSTSSHPEHHPAARKSAWVPAGCLLEAAVPPLSLLPSGSDASAQGNAASVPIPPSLVVSVSTPGVALMDYAPRGSGELDVRKGQPLRILKRYNHWSYAIKEDGGRGWLPSWFCGRANKSGSSAANAASGATGDGSTLPASSPATPTVPTTNLGTAVSSISSPSTASAPYSSSSLAPPIMPYSDAHTVANGASGAVPGQPGLGKPELSVAVSPASLRPGLPSTLSGVGVTGGGPKSAGPMQDGSLGMAAHERSPSGLPSSRSADAALAGAA